MDSKKNMKDKPQSVLFITHELSYTGAPLAVFEAALSLRKKGYEVHTVFLFDGLLSKKYQENDLKLTPYEDEEKLIDLAKNFDFAIVSTLVCANQYNMLKSFMPTAWWIQEKLDYVEYKEPIIREIEQAFSIITSSPPSQAEYLPYNKNNHLVCYGIKDAYRGKAMQIDHPCFALIGTIHPKKGQDIFIEAIESLPAKIRQKATFFIIGSAPFIELREQIAERIQATPEIVMLPLTTSYEKLCQYYENINALVAPSREEATSRVAIEAMMMGRPVIMSNVVGAQYLVEEGVNGFIFKTEDVDKLSEILARTIEHPEILEKMQQPAREAYLKYNSEEIFSNSLEDAILSDWKRYYK